jgi:hypothetical protein
MTNRGICDLPSCFVFSLPKAGSSLANALVRDLGCAAGLRYRSIMDEFFAQGVEDAHIPVEVSQSFEPTGTVYGGFRYLPPNVHIPVLPASRKIFLVRDPRDILTSWYFSVRESHVLPGGACEKEEEYKNRFIDEREKALSLEINRWVLKRTQGLIELLLSYKAILNDPLTRIFRYEDVIFNKPSWALEIVRHFGWDISEAKCKDIALRHDIRVVQEDSAQHIRNVKPGDHKDKLSLETILELNRRLLPFLEAFRYADSDQYFPEAIDLFSAQHEQPITCVLITETSPEEIAGNVYLPLRSDSSGEVIDNGSTECLGYWLEQCGSNGTWKTGVPFQICYALRFNRQMSNVVLGVSVYSSESELQFGRNTSEFGPLSFTARGCILVKWHFSGLYYSGEYLASVGVSSHASPDAFLFRQFRMRSFVLSE